MLVLNKITMGYQRQIFKEACFSAEFGEVTLIKGESGIGKSTLLEIISGQKEKCWQEYKINHLNIDELPDDQKEDLFKNKILYLRQNAQLFFDYTVEDNMKIFASAQGIEIKEVDIEKSLS